MLRKSSCSRFPFILWFEASKFCRLLLVLTPHYVLSPYPLQAGRLYACISSRPGQCGRADGYILEGKELDFYLRKLRSHKH